MIAKRSINLNSEPESWQQNANAAIMAVIKNKDQITYNALAATANMTGPHKIHRLTSWLEQLMAEDHHNDRPLRAAVVISKARGGLPAPGFFDKAKELGLDFDTTDKRASYEAYLQTVYTKFSES
ncbi:MAG: hypothetical protein ACPHCX_03245 [Candidatus Puniceispirillaceae bacterium]